MYLILGEGEVLEQALPEEMKDALDIYIKQASEFKSEQCLVKTMAKRFTWVYESSKSETDYLDSG